MKVSRRIATLLVAGVALAGMAAPAAWAQTTMRVLAGWTPNTSMVQSVEAEFIKRVNEAAKEELKLTRSGPEVVPAFEQLQPLSSGVFDLLITTPAYHQAQSGVGSAIDGILKTDSAALRQAGVIDFVSDYYKKKFGVELLALVQCPPNHIVLREPLRGDTTLTGRKVRSNAAFEGIVRGLGAAAIGLPPTEAYAAMQKGVIDGIAAPLHGTADFKFYEVGKYMTRPAFGHTTIVIMANARKIAALPPKLQTLIREEARKAEEYGAASMARFAEEGMGIMRSNGVQTTEFKPEVAAKLEGLFAEGTLAVARKSDPQGVDALVEFAKSKGMMIQ